MLTLKQISLVLEAVARVEGWDNKHNSIQVSNNNENTWITDESGLPLASEQLVKELREVEREHGGRKNYTKRGC